MAWRIHSGKKKPEHITASQTRKIWKKGEQKKLNFHTWGCSFVCQQKIVKELQRSFEMKGLLEQEEFWINQDMLA